MVGEYVYDGTLFLENISVDTIKKGLDTIQRAMDGIAFAFDNPVKWDTKYMIKGHQRGAALPNLRDMTILRNVIRKTQELNDITIDTAISWYKLGQITDNKLNALLCFHIAIEGLAIELANGKLNASKFFGVKKEEKATRKKRISDKIQEYFKNFNSTDLETFMRNSCDEILSIKADLERAMKAVFGENNPVIVEYLMGNESIWSIRGRIAHGEYSDWHYEQYVEVWKKLHRVQEISKAFITRIVLQIQPGTRRPSWHRTIQNVS